MEGNKSFQTFCNARFVFIFKYLYKCLLGETWKNVRISLKDYGGGTSKMPKFLLSKVIFRLNENGCLEHI